MSEPTLSEQIAWLRSRIERLEDEAAHFQTSAAESVVMSRAVLASLEAQQWRPIETAPKDGTLILVCTKEGAISMSRWYSLTEKWLWTPFYHWQELAYWMPLPAPPQHGEDK